LVWATVRDMGEVATTLDAIKGIRLRKNVAKLGAAVKQFGLLTFPKLDLMVVGAKMIRSVAGFCRPTLHILNLLAALSLMVNVGGGATRNAGVVASSYASRYHGRSSSRSGSPSTLRCRQLRPTPVDLP